jgi:hypothetical protein
VSRGCHPVETGSPDNFALTSAEDFVRLLLDNGGTYNAESRYNAYLDQYGNSYILVYYGEEKYYLECTLSNIPDTKLLLQLKDYIRSLGTVLDNPITDITFLEDLQQLKNLAIIETKNIVNFKPLGRLSSLEWLRIDNDDSVTIDCSIFANLQNLDALMLSTDKVINLETIFDKSKEEFKLPKLRYISLGEYTFDKNKYGSFLANVEGLTPGDKSSREKYGNQHGEKYVDQYGNRFDGKSGDKISVDILHTPDIDVLLRLKDNIEELHIGENSPITDISFIKDFSSLKRLQINNPIIFALASGRYSENLQYLFIDLTISKNLLIKNGYAGILDFLLSHKNFNRLSYLSFIDEDIKDVDEMYVLAREIFKMSSISHIGMGGNSFHRDYTKSYNFELGTYHILQYRANVRTEPSRNSEAIAVLSLNDEIEVLENTFFEEKINDVWGYWYKVKYGNITGYTFGGNIALETFVTDIDKNGIKDYFYFRFSKNPDSSWSYIEPGKDVIIYINGQRINTNVLSESKGKLDSVPFEWCTFEEDDGCVLIGLTQYGRHQYEYISIFKVTPDGKIEYMRNWNERDFW